MPELPEVETTLRGITPHIITEKINTVVSRQHQLRWPVNKKLNTLLQGHKFDNIQRRGKYLLFYSDIGTLIIHLGMSGSLRIVGQQEVVKKHDHFDISFSNKKILRFHDPRRFGAILWTTEDPLQHKLLKHLGPEPLSRQFNTNYIFKLAQNKKKAIKNFIMDSHVVVGVGNIYANEALFLSGIHPCIAAGEVSKQDYQQLQQKIKQVLKKAINRGGTTLKDFVNSDGKPGYFSQKLQVYNRENEPCYKCQQPIKRNVIGQRSSYYCPSCQAI